MKWPLVFLLLVGFLEAASLAAVPTQAAAEEMSAETKHRLVKAHGNF